MHHQCLGQTPGRRAQYPEADREYDEPPPPVRCRWSGLDRIGLNWPKQAGVCLAGLTSHTRPRLA
jgi:hypothetical protein